MILYKLTAEQYDKIWDKCVTGDRTIPANILIKNYLKEKYNAEFNIPGLSVSFNREKDLTWFLLHI